MSANEVIDEVEHAATEIRRGIAGERRGSDEAGRDTRENPTGDDQIPADVYADEILRGRLTSLDSVGGYASEEREEVVDCGDGVQVAVDPLDGSSNLATNNVVGTIVGVYDDPLPCSGRSLVAAAYVVYGPLTTMVVADDDGVRERVLETGEEREVELPGPTVYGFGGRRPEWTPEFEEFAGEVESQLKLRYGGAMVGDVNQVLHKGGVFSYPALRGRPEGKLRLVFEGAPMAYVVERAGGASSDGEDSLLDREPGGLHDRTPVHLGNERLIQRLESS